MEISPVHCANAPLPIVLTESGIVTDFSAEQYLKMLLGIISTSAPIINVVKLVQPLKAEL